MREIRGDPMDQLMHHHPPQRFREALPVGRLHHAVAVGGDTQYPGHAMVEDVNRARLGGRQIDAHRRWGEMPPSARRLGGRHDDHDREWSFQGGLGARVGPLNPNACVLEDRLDLGSHVLPVRYEPMPVAPRG